MADSIADIMHQRTRSPPPPSIVCGWKKQTSHRLLLFPFSFFDVDVVVVVVVLFSAVVVEGRRDAEMCRTIPMSDVMPTIRMAATTAAVVVMMCI